METSLLLSDDKRLRVVACEKFALSSLSRGTSLSLRAEVGAAGSGTATCRATLSQRLSLRPAGGWADAAASLDAGSASRPSVSYSLSAFASRDVSSDGLLTLSARAGAKATHSSLSAALSPPVSSALRPAAGARPPSKAGSAAAARATARRPRDLAEVAASLRDCVKTSASIELSQTLLGVGPKGAQDVALSLGVDLVTGTAYVALRENAWAIKVDLQRGAAWRAEYTL